MRTLPRYHRGQRDFIGPSLDRERDDLSPPGRWICNDTGKPFVYNYDSRHLGQGFSAKEGLSSRGRLTYDGKRTLLMAVLLRRQFGPLAPGRTLRLSVLSSAKRGDC